MEQGHMVLVFKTSVRKNKEVKRLKPVLNALTKGKDRWNFDLEDCDHILRIESDVLSAGEVVRSLNQVNVFCEELADSVNEKAESTYTAIEEDSFGYPS